MQPRDRPPNLAGDRECAGSQLFQGGLCHFVIVRTSKPDMVNGLES